MRRFRLSAGRTGLYFEETDLASKYVKASLTIRATYHHRRHTDPLYSDTNWGEAAAHFSEFRDNSVNSVTIPLSIITANIAPNCPKCKGFDVYITFNGGRGEVDDMVFRPAVVVLVFVFPFLFFAENGWSDLSVTRSAEPSSFAYRSPLLLQLTRKRTNSRKRKD